MASLLMDAVVYPVTSAADLLLIFRITDPILHFIRGPRLLNTTTNGETRLAGSEKGPSMTLPDLQQYRTPMGAFMPTMDFYRGCMESCMRSTASFAY